MHKYQYYNIPVTPDIKDASNPINILKVGCELAELLALLRAHTNASVCFRC
jgi:hypothetical protein